MLEYSEILPKKYILLDGEPYEVLTAQITKKQRQKPVNQVKLKHMRTGSVSERAFHQSDTVEEAEIEKRDIRYLYHRPARNSGQEEWWFANPDNPAERFSLVDELIGTSAAFLKENAVVTALTLDNEIIDITLPIKMELAVTETPPNVRGNTAQGGTKQATLETSAVVTVPLFIETGDIVRVNTETGEYVERVQKGAQ